MGKKNLLPALRKIKFRLTLCKLGSNTRNNHDSPRISFLEATLIAYVHASAAPSKLGAKKLRRKPSATEAAPRKEADMFNKHMAILAVAAAIASFPAKTDAAVYGNGSASSAFDVTLKIIANCVIQASSMDFGQSQGVLSSPLSATSSVTVTCTNSTPYNVGLGAGTGTGSTVAARKLAGTAANTDTISYQLLQAVGGSNWGDTQGTDTKSGVGSGLPQILTVFGVVPAQATPTPDSYKSSITATVYF